MTAREMADMDRRGSEFPHASAVETAFRHRGWMVDRRRVLAALSATRAPAARIERFDNCGARCHVEVSEDGQHYRLAGHYCGDRFCVPCGVGRSHKIRRWLTGVTRDRVVRLITLTLRPASGDLSEVLNYLLASFSRLRAQRMWKQAVSGGAYFVEMTRGQDGGHWHVHVHTIVSGTYINQSELSRAWKAASDGSYIVDVRAVPDRERAIGYIAKYATKGFSQQILANPDWLQQAMIALRGRRLVGTFGDWRKFDEDEQELDQVKYRSVGSIASIAMAAARDESWAAAVLQALGVKVQSTGTGWAFVDSG